jgi:hypothetical protein
MAKNNQNTITGVIFAKESREVPDTKNKNNGVPWVFWSITMETDHPNKSSKTFPEFELGSKATPDEFEVGDAIEVTYFLEGEERSWNSKTTGEKVSKNFTKVKALYIKHLDTNTLSAVGNDTPQEKRSKKNAEKEWGPVPDGDIDDENLPF